jgi:hypothetical protein
MQVKTMINTVDKIFKISCYSDVTGLAIISHQRL